MSAHTKVDLARMLAISGNLPVWYSKNVVHKLFECMLESLKEVGDELVIHDFGRFKVKPPRSGPYRHPMTGKPVQPTLPRVVFYTSNAWRKRLST